MLREFGIEHGQLHPAVAAQLADRRVALDDLEHRLGRGLDDEQNRTGSWISTICQGSPVRRSLAAPSMTPSSDAMLCGSFVPQP